MKMDESFLADHREYWKDVVRLEETNPSLRVAQVVEGRQVEAGANLSSRTAVGIGRTPKLWQQAKRRMTASQCGL